MKEDGLKILATARDETGLAVVTESSLAKTAVSASTPTCRFCEPAIQNYRLLEAVGDATRRCC